MDAPSVHFASTIDEKAGGILRLGIILTVTGAFALFHYVTTRGRLPA